jgi:D-serine deaminase-like pyridoxal phosphate-dependent protein
MAVNRLVLGGTPTFPVHAALDAPGVECSPGTCTLHDASYATKFPDLPFVPAALLLTRVISHPRPGRLCLDLGHKAVAADPPGARLTLLDLPDATLGGQSEEHLVVDTPRAAEFPPGTPLLAIPMHVCPTCALHRRVYVIEDGALVGEWDVSARDRRLAV